MIAKPKCPECGTTELSRKISSVAIPHSSRDYRNMSSTEMLSVLESGETRQVDEMFKQVGGGKASNKWCRAQFREMKTERVPDSSQIPVA